VIFGHRFPIQANGLWIVPALGTCFGHPQGGHWPDRWVWRRPGDLSKDLKRLGPAFAAEEPQADLQLRLRRQGMLRLEKQEALELADGTIIFPRLEQRLCEAKERGSGVY
jgi:hypothetical protein